MAEFVTACIAPISAAAVSAPFQNERPAGTAVDPPFRQFLFLRCFDRCPAEPVGIVSLNSTV